MADNRPTKETVYLSIKQLRLLILHLHSLILQLLYIQNRAYLHHMFHQSLPLVVFHKTYHRKGIRHQDKHILDHTQLFLILVSFSNNGIFHQKMMNKKCPIDHRHHKCNFRSRSILTIPKVLIHLWSPFLFYLELQGKLYRQVKRQYY